MHVDHLSQGRHILDSAFSSFYIFPASLPDTINTALAIYIGTGHWPSNEVKVEKANDSAHGSAPTFRRFVALPANHLAPAS